MSEQMNELNPGGLWRCNLCGGLVEEFGAYVCTTCIGLDGAALTEGTEGA